MKTTAIFAAAILILCIAMPALAGQEAVEENLMTGLSSENTGLQRSSALMLGQIHSTTAVIKLLTVLHSNENEDVRIAAAWALCQINDARGIFAVKQAVRFDDSKKVQAVCAWFYNLYIEPGSFKFVPREG